jgi:hypothetical protein
MDAVIAGQGSGILASPAFERIAHPTLDEAGRRVPAMRFGDPRVQALAGCLAVWDMTVTGITNKSLRAWMTGLRGVPYSMNQASYDLARLRRNGLTERIPRTNTYRLTGDGLTFALVCSRVHDQRAAGPAKKSSAQSGNATLSGTGSVSVTDIPWGRRGAAAWPLRSSHVAAC